MSNEEQVLIRASLRKERIRTVAGSLVWITLIAIAAHLTGCGCGRVYYASSANCDISATDTLVCIVGESELTIKVAARSFSGILSVKLYVDNTSSDTLYLAHSEIQVAAMDTGAGLAPISFQGYGATRTDRDGVALRPGPSTVEMIFDQKAIPKRQDYLILSGKIRDEQHGHTITFDSVRIDLSRYKRIRCA